MIVELSKSKKILMYISILLTSFAVMGEMAMVPIMYSFYTNYDYFEANYIASAPAFFLIIGSMVFTFLMRKYDKKALLTVAGVIFTVSSICCFAVPNVVFTCVMRSLMGMGEGAVNAVVMAYIAGIYLDERKRSSFMGYYNAAMTVAGIILSYGSGRIGAVDFTKTTLMYMPAVLMLIGIVLFVPGLKHLENTSTEYNAGQENSGKKEKLGGLYWSFILDYMIFTAMYGLFSYFISSYIMEMGLGDAALAGVLNAISSISGFALVLCFGKLFGKLKKNISILSIAIMILGLLLLYFTPGVATACVASALIGIAYSLYYTYSYAYVPEVVPVSRIDDAIGYTTSLYGVGFGMVTYLNSALMSLTNGSTVPLFLVWAMIGIVPLVIEVLTNKAYKKYAENRQW